MTLYIDPGTGSMLFTIAISIIGFLFYLIRILWVKAKYVFTRGKLDKIDKDRIPILIFAETKRYWIVFKPICVELNKHNIPFVYWTMSKDDPAFEAIEINNMKAEYIGEGNRAFARLNMANAVVLVASTPGLGVYQWKRSKLVDYYIHVQHGANDIAGYRMFGTDFFDGLPLSGQYQIDQIRELERKRNLPARDVELVGIPYMDEMRRRILATPRKPHENTLVLLAPSWGPNSIFNRFGTKVLDQLVSTGYDIIVRPHPQSLITDKEMMDKIISSYPETEHFHWDRSSDNFESLNDADILISDFSGIIFDFTLAFDKPLIYADTEFNPDCYDYYWLDNRPWTLDILPHIGLELNSDNLNNLKDIIDNCMSDIRLKNGRDKARKETWAHMDEGAERTVDFIIREYNKAAKEKK